jgi:hypothetical protein
MPPLRAKVESTRNLPGLSPVAAKPIEARFDTDQMSSDGGLLILREIEDRLKPAPLMGGCIPDPRLQSQVEHSVEDVLRLRMLMIAAGYEDGNDATVLRTDPMFKLAMDRQPNDADLCSQPTISRIENMPCLRDLLQIGKKMVGHYCASYPKAPKRIVLDIDDTFDAVHGEQQLRLFNAHDDEYGFQPLVVFDESGRMVCSVLRPACRPSGHQITKWLRRLIDEIRSHWPDTKIVLRADSHFCTPETLRFCRARGLFFIFGVAQTSTLRKHVLDLEQLTVAGRKASGQEKHRRFIEFQHGAKSWDQAERIIARIEASDRDDGKAVDTRFITTNLPGKPRALYEQNDCQRGQAENHIKAWKTHLAADRTSCCKATANQMRLFLHVGAYWLMWGLRSLMPRRSRWRTMPFDTLRLRLIKLAVCIKDLKTKIILHLPKATPNQPIFAWVLGHTARLIV